jgi:FAD/FMN-containing dehydrogenase
MSAATAPDPARPLTVAGGRELDGAAVRKLVAGLRGPVVRPGDAAYDEVRAVWNGQIDRHPALVVRCTGVADVLQAVAFAREHDLLLSVRGGGHNVAGNAVNDGGLVIDLSLMRGVHVDAAARTARVQGGATWGDVDRETQVHGLATPGGVISTTGVAGLTLHGGFGYLRNKHGLSLDNLRSVEIVTADGRVRTASPIVHPDLFWAVRGAGSNFGVVTSFEFGLHPVGPTVMLCAPLYALEDAPRVLPRWREYAETAPDELSTTAVFWSVPPGLPHQLGLSADLDGRPILAIAGLYAGPVEAGERVTRPLRELAAPLLDLSGPLPYTAVQSGNDGFVPKGLRAYWKSAYAEALSDDLLAALCRAAAARPSPRTAMGIWAQAGAVTRVGAAETAFGPRPPYLLSFEANWTDPQETEANVAWAREAHAAARPFAAGGPYLNFLSPGGEAEDPARAAYGPNYARLARLKAEYDPTNLFRTNQNIHPAA